MKGNVLTLGKKKMTVDDIDFFLSHPSRIVFDASSLKRMDANAEFLMAHASRHIVYGLNTGLGPMAKHILPKNQWVELQYNLIRSHALGMGAPLGEQMVKSIMLVRLNTLLLAHSGIYTDAAFLLKSFLEKGVTPVVPEHGSVGASGDLVQLAHVALALIGEGEVFYKGKIQPAKKVLKTLKLSPLSIRTREGLAIMNGTSGMSGIGSLVVLESIRLITISTLLTALLYEISHASKEYIHPAVHALRPHAGQEKVAESLRTILSDSFCLRKNPAVLNGKDEASTVGTEDVQHLYSIRCAPQIIGPIYDACAHAKDVLEKEINSVTDNPLILTNKEIIHGGNFHGDYVSFEMDKLKIALTKLSILAERHINYVCNPKLNLSLPPFLNLGVFGFNLGLQGLQFVATSTTAENQALSTPMSIHSISTNNDNQDVVSMGTNAALSAHKVVENTYHVLSVEIIALARATYFLNIENHLSSRTRVLYREVRKIISFEKEDIMVSKDVANIDAFLRTSPLFKNILI